MAQRPSEKVQRRYHAWRDSIDIEEEITGKFGAVKVESQPPKAKFALAVLKELPPHWRGPVVLFALGIVAILAWRGGALAGLWR